MFWDAEQGVTTITGEKLDKLGSPDCGATMTAIRTAADANNRRDGKDDRRVWIMRDLNRWLDGPIGIIPLRQLRNLAKHLPRVVDRKSAQAIIVLTTDGNIPADLQGHATVVEWPLPDRSEIEKVLDTAVQSLPEFESDKKTGEPILSKPIRALAITSETREISVDAAVGLTADEAASCFAKSLVQTRVIDPRIVSAEKKRVIARERVLEWMEPLEGGLDES